MVTINDAITNKLNEKSNMNTNYYGECSLDYGGYFLINGNEKVLISQEKIAPNIIQVHSKHVLG